MIGAASQRACSPPPPIAAGSTGIGLARDMPAAIAGIKVAIGLLRRGGASMGTVIGPFEHGRFLGCAPSISGFQHKTLRRRLGQELPGDATACSRSDEHS